MCRLFLANRKAVLDMHKLLKNLPAKNYATLYLNGSRFTRETYPQGIEDLLFDLEVSFGGHGNGLVLIKDKQLVTYKKGVDFSVEESANLMLTLDYDWAIWHTRLASAGKQNDANCHPFVHVDDDGNILVWAMNGTEMSTVKIAAMLGDITDTEVCGLMVAKLGLPIPEGFKAWHSVFVGVYNDIPFAFKGTGDLCKWLPDKDTVLFASELPTGIGSVCSYDYSWINGVETEIKRVHSYANNVGYGYGFDEDGIWDSYSTGYPYKY